MLRILLADDNQQFISVVENFFKEKPDVEVVGVAGDGWACLELVHEQEPDILLLDMVMPRLDGLGVLDRLQMMPQRPKVIMLTAYLNESMIQRALAKGAMDYLIKPLDLEMIYLRLKELEEMYPTTVNECGAIMGNLALADTVSPYRLPKSLQKRRPLEVEITTLLHDMGVPAHVKGYQYLRDAILMILDNFQLLTCITKELYPQIAEKYETTPSRVERAIRHAIELAWDRGNVDLITEYFGYSINLRKGKPTNSEFLAMVSDRMRLNY
ncbi:MAG: sporulation transcription factor Spo0A [Peptococcaceae bacterium]|nr:sporulation transcription factor Spo0A [Peptococcaceae bacterium]